MANPLVTRGLQVRDSTGIRLVEHVPDLAAMVYGSVFRIINRDQFVARFM